MEFDAWFTLAVVVLTVGALVTERVSPPFAMMGAVTVLLVGGVIDAEQALTGFSNPAPFTVAALYVLAQAAEVTGSLEPVVESALSGGRTKGRGRLARVLLPTAAASAFLNNTTIVAMVAPRVAAWGRRTGQAASPYLMPISYATILGGLITIVGTSTNVVVAGLMVDAGLPALGFFEIGRVGLPLAVGGMVVMIATAAFLLPNRRTNAPDYLRDAREFTVEMVVNPGSPLAGRSVAEAGLRNLEAVFLVEIERAGHIIGPVGPDEVLAAGDRLTFAGNADRILDLQRIPGLSSAEERHFALTGNGPGGPRFYEVVVAPDSNLAGRTLKDVGFRARYGAAVVAIHRAGERVPGKLGTVSLRPGDVLLLLADPGFLGRGHETRDFLVVSPLSGKVPLRTGKAWIVVLVGAGLVTSVALGALDILEAALLAAGALVVGGVLTPAEARDAIDINVVVMIAASFGLGEAILASGLAGQVADGLIGPFGSFGEIGILAGVLLATMALTELVTNNSAAVLMFPIALATAQGAGLDPRPFAIVIAVGASASFLTPIGYQTNTMVYGLGGYRFGDFARLGVPLNIVTFVLTLLIVPLAWPLRG